ncbi:MAG: TolB family protein [Planctomycetota bacterium]|jgi:hypothetical protein
MRIVSSIVAAAIMTLMSPPGATAGEPVAEDWPGEAGILSRHVQLTFSDRFVKAGESYFSPDDRHIVFQGIEKPAEGEAADEFYAMYAGDVVHDRQGRITGMNNIRRLSPKGSANTCGWFHPTKPDTVVFGCTIGVPGEPNVAGWQRGVGRYKWQFPREMTIVECDINEADGTADTLDILLADDGAYLAECSLTSDGRFLLYCSYVEAEAPWGGNLFVRDLETGVTHTIVHMPGYDGGPFFSPGGDRICYRSDRNRDNLLQIYVGELSYDENGNLVGLAGERQITNNEHVNWAPFWDKTGRYLLYTTSEQGHRNYEVYIIDTSAPAEGKTYEDSKRRITDAAGFDGLPVFDSTGRVMMWTSQRADGSSQLWVADFKNPLEK